MTLEEIFNQNTTDEIISYLKKKDIHIPSWEKLVKEYEPSKHDIVEDKVKRKDKIHSDGTKDEAARISVGLEKLLTKRITEFTFAIPVKRVYTNTDNEVRKQIAQAIENIYTVAHINSENIQRGNDYYASCEILTLWYTKKEENNLYGFNSQYKLKCKSFSPKDGTKIYPLFDELDDLIALSFEYEKKIADQTTTYFETYTADRHYRWKRENDEKDWTEITNDAISIKKIPCSYVWRPKPCWDGLSVLREDLEYTISRNSDVIAYNAAPILKVSGSIIGDEIKGETRRVYRVTEGGDVSYVSWGQSVEALKYHVDTLIKLFFMQSQMPDISFENMKTLGNIGYESRKTLLSDAHLKIGDESGAWTEFFERETNVIKAFLKEMNKQWSPSDIDAVHVEHVITPFIQEDEETEINKWMKADGGKPLVSHKDAIKNAALTDDADRTYNEILQEEQTEAANKMTAMNLFSAE